MRHIPIEERFWSRVKIGADCWEWTGIKYNGYGYLSVYDSARKSYTSARAHRLSYEIHTGTKLRPECHLDHLCRNRGCVNPAHLEPVTQRENTLRGFGPTALNSRKTHCKYGHPLSGKNLCAGSRPRERRCRTCHRNEARRKRLA